MEISVARISIIRLTDFINRFTDFKSQAVVYFKILLPQNPIKISSNIFFMSSFEENHLISLYVKHPACVYVYTHVYLFIFFKCI